MDVNQELGSLKWSAFEPQAKLPRSGSGKLPKQTNDYVTWGEMQEFQRSICQIIRLLLESYLTDAIELEPAHFDIHLN